MQLMLGKVVLVTQRPLIAVKGVVLMTAKEVQPTLEDEMIKAVEEPVVDLLAASQTED